jgi:hypothetical protein
MSQPEAHSLSFHSGQLIPNQKRDNAPNRSHPATTDVSYAYHILLELGLSFLRSLRQRFNVHSFAFVDPLRSRQTDLSRRFA